MYTSSDSFLSFQVHKGVYGFVRDRHGQPVSKAQIVLNEGVKVYTKEGGYFHVLLAPGYHKIHAIAEGYQQQHVKVWERHTTALFHDPGGRCD